MLLEHAYAAELLWQIGYGKWSDKGSGSRKRGNEQVLCALIAWET